MPSERAPRPAASRPLPWRTTVGGRMVLSFCTLFAGIWILAQSVELYGLPKGIYEGWLQHLRQEEFLRLSSTANERKLRLEEWIKERRNDVAIVAQSRPLADFLKGLGQGRQVEAVRREALAEWLQQIRDTYGVIDAVSVLDPAGRQLASDDPARGARPLPAQVLQQIGAPGQEEILAVSYDAESQRPILQILRKILDETGGVPLAWLAFSLDLDEELRSHHEFQLTDLIGASAEMLLYDPQGRFVIVPRHALADGSRAQPLVSRDPSTLAQLAINGGEGQIVAADYRNQPVLAAYRYLRVTPELGWGLVVKKDEREAFAMLQKHIATFALTAALGIVAMVAAAWLIARQLTRPLRRMVAAAHAIADGQWSARVRIEGRGEMAELAGTFNYMAERLDDWHAELDREVALKTQEILDQEGRLLAFSQATTDGIITIDEAARITFWNPAAERIFGYTEAEALGREVHDLLAPPEAHPQARAAFGQYARTGTGNAFNLIRELTGRTKAGEEIIVEITISPLHSRGRRHAVGIFRDITSRKRMENALRLVAEQLSVKVGDEYFRTLASGLGQLLKADRVVVGELLCGQPATVRILGIYSARGASAGDSYALPGSPCEAALGEGICLIAGGLGTRFPAAEAGHEAYAGCALGNAHGGNIGILSVFWSHPLAEGEDPLAYLRIFAARAGAELERLQAERALARHLDQLESTVAERTRALQQSNDELSSALVLVGKAQKELVESEKLASLGSLVAGIAHELNTPIGTSLTVSTAVQEKISRFAAAVAAGAIRRSVLDTFMAEMTQGAGLLVKSLERAASLIHDFKQVSVDQTSSQRRPFDLGQVVEEVVAVMHPRLKKTRQRIVLDIHPGLGMDSYPGPLGQVIANLVQNALVHAFEEDQDGCIAITARAKPGDEVIELEVADDGKGMAAAVLEHIFEPFFTTRLGKGGSGLGMHITYNLVNGVLGGRIAVDSRIGEGTTVRMELPRTAPRPAEIDGQAADLARI